MKGTLILCMLLYSSFNLINCDETTADDNDVTEGDNGEELSDFQKKFPGGPIDKDEFKENFVDLLGPTWTMLDMPDLTFYILPFLNYSTAMLVPHMTRAQVQHHWEGNADDHRMLLNMVLKEWREEEPNSEIRKMSLLGILQNLDRIPSRFRERIADHGGSYVNHAFFFGLLHPNYDSDMRFPEGEVRQDIELAFQTFFKFKAKFNMVASKLKGSGWVFLVRNKKGFLQIETTSNNDSPISRGSYPLLVLDMWEHAWYLKHHQKRGDYADDWWMLVDWTRVAALDAYWKEYDLKVNPDATRYQVDRDEL